MPVEPRPAPLRTWWQGALRVQLFTCSARLPYCLDLVLEDLASGRRAEFLWDAVRPEHCVLGKGAAHGELHAGTKGHSALVVADQGIGDFVQQWRFLPMVAQQFETVHVQCREPLRRLALMQDPAFHVVGFEESAPEAVSLSMMRLDRLFSDPCEGTPYLRSTPPQERGAGDRLRVGLNWAPNPNGIAARLKTVPTLSIASLVMAHPDVAWVSVQFGDAEQALQQHQALTGIAPLGRTFRDVADLATAIAGLDLLITIDSAPAHVAGALGVPVWMLLARPADWRWPARGEVSHLYGTMRLFHQKKGGAWDDVLARVSSQLRDAAADRSRLVWPIAQRGSGLVAALPASHGDGLEGRGWLCREELASPNALTSERLRRFRSNSAPHDATATAEIFAALVEHTGCLPWGSIPTREER